MLVITLRWFRSACSLHPIQGQHKCCATLCFCWYSFYLPTEGWKAEPTPSHIEWVLNPGPVAWQSTALPTELFQPVNVILCHPVCVIGIYVGSWDHVEWHFCFFCSMLCRDSGDKMSCSIPSGIYVLSGVWWCKCRDAKINKKVIWLLHSWKEYPVISIDIYIKT